jgi:hypothetical protein
LNQAITGLCLTKRHWFVIDKNVKKNDRILITEVSNRLIIAKMEDPKLRFDEDGDAFFLLHLEGEIQMFFLQAISHIDKSS